MSAVNVTTLGIGLMGTRSTPAQDVRKIRREVMH